MTSTDTARTPPTLPPYSGRLGVCPKCTCDDLGDRYYPYIPQLIRVPGGYEVPISGGWDGECMLRSCRDCGWAWLEACADDEHAGEPPPDPFADPTRRPRPFADGGD